MFLLLTVNFFSIDILVNLIVPKTDRILVLLCLRLFERHSLSEIFIAEKESKNYRILN